MSTEDLFQPWLKERGIVDVEAFVPDMAGAALQALRGSDAMRGVLSDRFVDMYCAVKDDEYREFQEIVTPYEREILMFNV